MRDGFVVHAAEGALGGALGTLLIKQTKALGRRIPEPWKPASPSRDPADLVVTRVERARGRPFSIRTHDRFAGGLKWAYGITWGGLLGAAMTGLHVRSPRQTVLTGAAMGALVWAVGYAGWLPRTGLTSPITRQGTRRVLTSLAIHVAFGVAASAPILMIESARRARRPWWERVMEDARERISAWW